LGLDLFVAVWVFVGIQSPLLIFCSYGLLKRFDWLASPKLVFPSVAAVSLVFFLFFDRIATNPAFYSHFLFAGGFLLLSYFLLVKWEYSKVDALVLSILTVIAIDELWQMPMNIVNWSTWHGFAVGFTTAGWNLMSMPFTFYFILKSGRQIVLNFPSRIIIICTLATGIETVRFAFNPLESYETPYYLIILWFLFFQVLFRQSRFIKPK
jgi:hypothetical protein